MDGRDGWSWERGTGCFDLQLCDGAEWGDVTDMEELKEVDLLQDVVKMEGLWCIIVNRVRDG